MSRRYCIPPFAGAFLPQDVCSGRAPRAAVCAAFRSLSSSHVREFSVSRQRHTQRSASFQPWSKWYESWVSWEDRGLPHRIWRDHQIIPMTVTNSRDQKLHAQIVKRAHSTHPSNLVMLCHGYSSHINRPTFQFLADALVDACDSWVLKLDFVGHGFSEGERAYVECPTHLIDDILSTIEHTCLEMIPSNAARSKVPFFFCGHSMGAASTLLTVAHFQSQQTTMPCFDATFAIGGWAGLAPALATNVHESPLLPALRVAAKTFPQAILPTLLYDPAKDNADLWVDPEFTERMVQDWYDPVANPTGLSWGKNIRIGTGFSILKLMELVQEEFVNITTPLLVVHDPDDKFASIEGAEMLLDMTNTPKQHRKLVELHGGKHDLLANLPDEVAQHVTAWVNQYKAATHPQVRDCK